MTDVLQFAALGTGTGSLVALIAVGLVLIFRAAGVINLAHGGYAMLGAYLHWELQQRGWGTPAAFVTATAAVVLVGLLTDQMILRRLRQASALTRLIATMGVLLLIQSLTAHIWGAVPKTTSPIIPSRPLDLGGSVLPSDRLWLLLIALGATVVITVIWNRTRLGWIAEAVSENQRMAAALGWSPELVSGITWAVGAGLAAAAGILIAPITELDTSTMPLLIIPALAAALIGGFRSYPLTCAGAILIGIAQTVTSQYVHITGVSDALPFLIIVVGLALRGSGLPLRGYATDRLPRVGSGRVRWYVLIPAVVIGVFVLNGTSSPDALTAFTSTFAVATIFLSFVVLIGYTGQVSLAQYSLAGFGALFAARLAADADVPFWLAILIGALGASLVGIVFAIPALRTRGANLTVVTFGLAQAAQSVIFNNPDISGSQDGILVPTPEVFGLSVDPVQYPERYAIFALIVLALVAVAVAMIRRSRVGRRLLAVRENERAAAANGINVIAAKITGFAIAGAIAGIGGVVLAFQSEAIIFSVYDPLTSISMLAFSVIGGLGFVLGAVFGALFAPQSVGAIITLHWQTLGSYITVIGAAGLLITLAMNPHGWVYEALKAVRRLDRIFPPPAGRRAAGEPGNDAVSTDGGAVPTVPVTLSVSNLSVRYGGNRAVDGVEVELRGGEIVGLIGPNGAGKTSFMDAVTGFTAISSGTVLLDGTDISGLPAYRRVRAGLVRSFQSLELYPDLTVRENVLVAGDRISGGARPRFWPALRLRRAELSANDRRTVDELGLGDSLDRLPEQLSYGQRRLLAIARAIASAPSVLLVDEPVAGLDDAESAEFAHVLTRLARQRGMGILVIEHDMNFVMSTCDRIIVIDFGHQIAQGPPAAIREDPAAIAAYLGDDVTATPADSRGRPDATSAPSFSNG
ncbi:MAG TPA: branched-chain amino acid ABC transporter permease/ATP-binding protein [Amycolatopsis sp.]|uniref:branched-chain amino acid ABC transporter permease/ATP-binding protein n=1 Tax=Amycolatopsis sp. TaxID=37632 RepID=UPI002B48BFC4|nr:branched-chain amino acid ABC transporter permease/ATP-binding protein [Amycolatopsis sp.]HKS48181.1 branched-chain amino acid ABC transporter permease/ATP-binding protein [Amycolatopsis sp.]